MNDDLIVQEVRQARDEYATKFDYDLDAICKDLQSKQEQPGNRSFPSRQNVWRSLWASRGEVVCGIDFLRFFQFSNGDQE